MQEPSAMIPAGILPLSEGNLILDACCAPGGKSTQLACRMKERSLLVSNDISASRQNATLKNIERFGITDSLVTISDLRDFARKTDVLFDRILVDGPCSGEGMFRKDHSLADAWEKKPSTAYTAIQKDIVKNALELLKPGGYIVYSTCTFSVCENEEIVRFMKEICPDLELIDLHDRFPYFDKGVLPGLEGCLRIYPHKVRGEGHFAALLHRKETASASVCKKEQPVPFRTASLSSFLKHIRKETDPSRIVINKDRVLLEPEGASAFRGIRTLRSGLLLGTMKKDRFEPSQHLAFSLKADEFDQVIRLEPGDDRVQKYLRGETVFSDSEADGWVLVCAGDYPLGFGICREKIIKNKIGKSWRKI
jgi:NOL1/NOP2/fmu family ribosome biogenesis protein/23S rRNA U2552 (ribose-2'-O)-methylase RlmE/FtsJ